MLEIFKIRKKRETVEDILERAANRFFDSPEVREILRSQPDTNEILNEVLERREKRKCKVTGTTNFVKQ